MFDICSTYIDCRYLTNDKSIEIEKSHTSLITTLNVLRFRTEIMSAKTMHLVVCQAFLLKVWFGLHSH